MLSKLWEAIKGWLWPAPEPEPLPPPIPSPDPPPEPKPEPLGDVTAEDLLDLHNANRSPNLTLDPLLMLAAQQWAQSMANRGKLSHADLSHRVTAAGYHARSVGENIAMGYKTPASVVAGWMRSSGHRRNITNAVYLDVGFGVADMDGRRWWCAIFASTFSQTGTHEHDEHYHTYVSDPPGIAEDQSGLT